MELAHSLGYKAVKTEATGLYSRSVNDAMNCFNNYMYLKFFSDEGASVQGTGIFVILYFVILFVLSCLLLQGVRTDIRGFMLPWVYTMYIALLFQAMFGLWLIFGYYIYLETVFVALCDWTWMAFNYYCVLVVRSHLRNVKYFQSPDIEYLNDI